MSNMDKEKDINRDVRPSRGQESNENWDDRTENSEQNDSKTSGHTDARIIDEQTNTSGAGSSQRSRANNAIGGVGPLDADMEQLPSQKRRDRGM